MKRIHIVGSSPRTGTTLMAELMIACFEVDAHGEHEDSVFTMPPHGANVFLTKRPGDILRVRPLLRRLQDLHVVYLVRDPRDTITSTHPADPDRYWCSLRYWKAYTAEAKRLASEPRFTVVRFEDLVTRPDDVQAALHSRLPFLTARGPFSRFHELARPSELSSRALRGVRPIDPAAIGQWRKHLPRVAGQLVIHGSIARDLVEHGYEPDSRWLADLDGVEPDLRPSHWPERWRPLELWRRRAGAGLQARWYVKRLDARRAPSAGPGEAS